MSTKSEPKIIIRSDRETARKFYRRFRTYGTYDHKTNEIEIVDGALWQEYALEHEKEHWRQSGTWRYKFAVWLRWSAIAQIALLLASYVAGMGIPILGFQLDAPYIALGGLAVCFSLVGCLVFGFLSYHFYEKGAEVAASKAVFGESP
jgi:hypothetical protein